MGCIQWLPWAAVNSQIQGVPNKMTEILYSPIHTTLNQKLSDIHHYNGKVRKFCLLIQLGRYLNPFWRTVTKCKITISGFVVIYMFGRAQKCTIFSKKWILKFKCIKANPYSLHSQVKSNLVEFWENLRDFLWKSYIFARGRTY